MNLNRSPLIDELVPSEFYLSQNYPNPFIGKTIIKYCVAYKTNVRLEVFDPERKMIKILLDEEKEAGTYEVNWNAVSAAGGLPSGVSAKVGYASGVYFYRLEAGDFIRTRKMILLK